MKEEKKSIPQATFLIRFFFSLLSVCLCRRIIITKAPFFLYIYVQSRLARLFSLIYHCRKQAVVTIEYLLSYLTISSSKGERPPSLLTFITLFVPFTFTAMRI
jgi:hypothetical protein